MPKKNEYNAIEKLAIIHIKFQKYILTCFKEWTKEGRRAPLICVMLSIFIHLQKV